MTRALAAPILACFCFTAASLAHGEEFAPDLVKKGARTYDNNCAQCHGDKLVNSGGAAFDLKRLRDNERPRFNNSVLNGKNAMPAWHGIIKDPDLDALWAYIRTNAYP